MPLWLIGMMASGKTSVAQMLAIRTDSPFLDTDQLIEAETGLSVAEVFADEGEAGFRRRESAAVTAAASVIGAVVATGGGAVLDPGNVAKMTSSGPVVWLQARPEALVARIADPSSRPLLKGGTTEKELADLLSERRHAYEAAADHVVSTDDATLEEVVLLVEEIWTAS